MHLTFVHFARRFLNSPHHCFRRPPKQYSRFLKREKYFRFSAWLYSDARDKFRTTMNFMAHSFTRQTKQREYQPQLENWFHKKRIEGALEEHRMTFGIFEKMLQQANIKLNMQMLSFLALYEPASFKSLAMLTRQMALKKGYEISSKEPLPENVIIPKTL